jgi:1-acyl-sn-glycerol-3-phosphate acyltransferase
MEEEILHLVRFCRSVGRSLKVTVLLLFGALELIVRRPATRKQQAEWLHQLCARGMRWMNIKVGCQGTFPSRGVVISNHLGYLDVILLAALHPCVFVAKSEIRSWPFLGWIATMAGTVYVDRGRGGSAVRAAGGMQAAEDAGIPVVFFPEGTTSNGTSVLKFHSGLLVKSLEAAQPITAAYIRFRLTEDNGPGVTVEDYVSYWGDTLLVKHIFRLLGLRGIEVDVRFADFPIEFSRTDQRKLLAAEARAAVMELGGVRDVVTAD